MFLLSLLLSIAVQDASQANRGKVFQLGWETASAISDLAPCSIRPVDFAYAKAHTWFGDGYRGGEHYHFAYLASVEILSDTPITRPNYESLASNAVFQLSFPKDEAIALVATGRLGDVSQRRNIIVLLATDKPIRSIECAATTDV